MYGRRVGPDPVLGQFFTFFEFIQKLPFCDAELFLCVRAERRHAGLIPGFEAVHCIVNVKNNRLNHGSSVYIATSSISRLADMITSFPSFT